MCSGSLIGKAPGCGPGSDVGSRPTRYPKRMRNGEKVNINKKVCKAVRKSFDKRVEETHRLPFKKRLRWAWRIVRGRAKG